MVFTLGDELFQVTIIFPGAQCARGEIRIVIGTGDPRHQEISNYAKETGMKMNPAEVDRRLDQSMHAWESACPEQPFAEMTLEQFKQTRQLCLDAKAKLAAAEAQWQAARKE